MKNQNPCVIHWLWLCQLLRHENLKRLWRRSRVDGCCRGGGGCTPRDRILSTQTFSSNPSAPNPYYTNVFSQSLWTWFLLHKLFLATALHLILSTQTFSWNSSRPDAIYTNFSYTSFAPDSYYTNVFSQLLCTWFLLHKRFLATPLDLILTTQTFSRNCSAPDSIYTNFFLGTPLDLMLSTQTFLTRPLHLILITQTLSQPLCTWFLLHKLFLATPLHLVLTTQTFCHDSSTHHF